MKWAFCANPQRYRIREAVSHLEIDYWTSRRSDVRASDQAIIWQTLDSDGHRGIVAFAEIIGDPKPSADEFNPFWVNQSDGLEIVPRVPVRYAIPEGLPLWIDNSGTGDFLRSLSVARSQGGTVFRITPEQWSRLTELVPFSGISIDAIEAQEHLRYRTRARGGQGFGLSRVERCVIEEYAMHTAIVYFEQSWDLVKDVSATSSYDLLCRRGQDELRIEVKGTITAGNQIILTRNELNEARQPGYALFIVSEIAIDRSNPQKPTASGGTARLFSPWTPDPSALQPINFTCNIDLLLGTIVGPS